MKQCTRNVGAGVAMGLLSVLGSLKLVRGHRHIVGIWRIASYGCARLERIRRSEMQNSMSMRRSGQGRITYDPLPVLLGGIYGSRGMSTSWLD